MSPAVRRTSRSEKEEGGQAGKATTTTRCSLSLNKPHHMLRGPLKTTKEHGYGLRTTHNDNSATFSFTFMLATEHKAQTQSLGKTDSSTLGIFFAFSSLFDLQHVTDRLHHGPVFSKASIPLQPYRHQIELDWSPITRLRFLVAEEREPTPS